MRLVHFLEDTFAITVSPEDVTIDHFACIDSIAAYVDARAK